MALTITHPFVSPKTDGSDATQIQPSNWNAAHTLSQASGTLLGRATAGTGTTEELTPAQALTLLAFADSVGANGYIKIPLPGGTPIYVQWGSGTPTSGDLTVTWPIAFPTACRSVVAMPNYSASATELVGVHVTGASTTGAVFKERFVASGGAVNTTNQPIYWLAVGN